MEIIKENNYFLVINKESVYIVELNPVTCSCPHFKYRNVRCGEFCKHIQAVIDMLQNKLTSKDKS